MCEIAVIDRHGMWGYRHRVRYQFTVTLYLNTCKGQHVSLGLAVWRFEGTVGMGLWDR